MGVSIGNHLVGTLFLHTRLASVRWQTRSLIGRHLLGTCHVIFIGIGPEIASRSHWLALTALANALLVLANAPRAVLLCHTCQNDCH